MTKWIHAAAVAVLALGPWVGPLAEASPLSASEALPGDWVPGKPDAQAADNPGSPAAGTATGWTEIDGVLTPATFHSGPLRDIRHHGTAPDAGDATDCDDGPDSGHRPGLKIRGTPVPLPSGLWLLLSGLGGLGLRVMKRSSARHGDRTVAS
jgi:hypothetical protein